MLKPAQIKLIQMAARAAGLRGDRYQPDGRYYLLLGQYRQPSGKPVTSCKQLNHYQLLDFLAICESLGWQHPGHGATHYHDKARWYGTESEWNASGGAIAAIRHLAGDLGMSDDHLAAFVTRQSKGAATMATLSSYWAWQIIEALKAMLGRRDGTEYKTLADVTAAYGDDGKRSIDNRQF